MKGLDFSNCKKVSQDKHSATFKHDKGHEIKIAIAGLTPMMRKKLEALPLHKAGAGEDDNAVIESPEAPIAEPLAAQAPPALEAEPVAEVIEEKPVAEVVEEVPVAEVEEFQPIPTQEELDEEEARTQRDLTSRKIKPETAQSLFAKKDTLGKIGTIFGAILGGMGSGLTKQPNVFLEQMNKQIEQDLDMQKTNIENQRNFYKLQMEHDLNQANTRRGHAEAAKTEADIAGMGELNLAKNRVLRNEYNRMLPEEDRVKSNQALDSSNAALSARNGAKNKMLSATYQHLMDQVNKMPPGPTRDNAMKTLVDTLAPAITKEIQENNAKTVAQVTLNTKINKKPAPAKEQGPEKELPAVDLQRMQSLITKGELGLPGQMNGGDASAANQEAKQVQDNRAVAKMFDDSFKKLSKMALAGKLNPQMRQAEIATLLASIARETAGRYVTKEVEAQAQALFPDMKDYIGNSTKTRKEKYDKAMEYFQSQEAATPTLDRFKLKRPFPKYSFSAADTKSSPKGASKPSGPKEGATGKDKAGNKVVYENGKWRKA